MPNSNSPDAKKGKNTEEKREFIKERIVKPPMTKRQAAVKALTLLFSAAFFGIIAAVTFAITAPFAKEYLAEETKVSTSVTIPTDAETEPTETESLPEMDPALETCSSENLIESAVSKELETLEFSEENWDAFYKTIQDRAADAERGLVTITAVRQQTDLFNNPVETAGMFSGAIIAETPSQYLILTPADAVADMTSIQVKVCGGQEVPGQLVGVDNVAGLAVISIEIEGLEKSCLEQIKVLELGNSYAIQRGELLTAVGSPAGYPQSSGVGAVSYVRENVQIIDGTSQILYVDVPGNADKGTFLIDRDRRLVGWVTNDFQVENSRLAAVRTISDYKPILEKLSNGIPIPYIGIMGQAVREDELETGIPAGIYVNRAINDSPAYQAGIQAGDIITEVNGISVDTRQNWREMIDDLQAGTVVPVKVQRYSRDAYIELEYQVTIGAR